MKFAYYFFFISALLIPVKADNAAQNQMDTLKEYCKTHPDNWAGYNNLAREYYFNKDYDKAHECFTQALEKCPQPEQQEQIFYNLGNTHFRRAQELDDKDEQKLSLFEKSIQHYESALALNKEASDTKHNLEVVKRKIEELKKKQTNSHNEKQDKEEQNQDKQKAGEEAPKNDPQKKQEDSTQSNPSPQQNESQSEEQPKANETNKQEPKGSPENTQPGDSNQPTKASGDSKRPTHAGKQQEMEAILQRAKAQEKMLPIEFANQADRIPNDKILKDW